MSLNFLYFDGYGQFIWPAFAFTLTCCFSLYLKTKKELRKHEKMFLSAFKHLRSTKIAVEKYRKISREVLSRNSFI